MTYPGYQFKSPSFQETPAQLVTIGNVDVLHRTCSAIPLNGGGNLPINLSTFNGPVLVWPKSGEQWYVKLLKGQWVLAERNYISAQAYLTDASPGDQVWNIQGNLTISATGTVNIADDNGVLATHPAQPTWNSVSYENAWSDYGSGYPPVQYIVDGNIVRFRGVMKPGSPSTDGTPVFNIPVQYAVPVIQQGFALTNVLGSPGANFKLVANSTGEFWIYSVGSCIAMFVDSVSYFYKY